MRRMGTALLLVGLVGCQDAAPTDIGEAGSPAFSSVEDHAPGEGEWTVRFERLVGNEVTGANGAIRGQNAGGIPWRLERGEARLGRDGALRVSVRGLVLRTTGVNPVAAFKAILSCLTPDGNSLVTVNVSTATVPVGPEGDADIREHVAVPSPCYAPIVLVTSGGGSWFAASGM